MAASELNKKHAQVEASIHDNHGGKQRAREIIMASASEEYEQTARSGRRCSRVGRRRTLAIAAAEHGVDGGSKL